ncbi:MAG TPA: FAD-binding oxidoreductase [Kofleriaceae bacterium]|nr:FAD-binding oxidoreductase [Kofleriaceae bacterium]
MPNDGNSRSLWAWGTVDRFPDDTARTRLAGMARMLTGGADAALLALPRDEDARIPEPRIAAPASLAAVASAEPRDRALHAHGRAYPDLVRGFRGDFAAAPDVVLRPSTAAEVAACLDWCSDARVACVPFGGGTSVVGGVEVAADRRGAFAGVASLDLGGLATLHEVDRESLAVRAGAGFLGPELERALAAHDLTLRHYPQSFEHSTLGGWIAPRAGGHFATGPTHIDDFVESLTAVTPRGTVTTRRLPASGAGPAPERLWIGSEGALGVITEAWMRVQRKPRFRASASVKFKRTFDGAKAARALAQSGLRPANCRLLDPAECLLHQVALDGTAVLLVAFESVDHDQAPALARALELVRDFGGTVASGPKIINDGDRASPSDAAGEASSWKKAFVDAPYLQSALVSIGVMADTFETACTWDRFEAFHTAVTTAAQDALKRTVGAGLVACRFTHVYPDGPAPYYTFIGPAKVGDELSVWREVKAAVSEALHTAGGTITHHHAVGRTHRPWYDRERPELFGAVLRAAKQTLDPAGVMNPGVLVD